MSTKVNKLPKEYQPLSPWAYFGYAVLYAIPIIGWVFLIVLALDDSNINRRNFSRSYFVIIAIWLILAAFGLAVGFWARFFEFVFLGK